MLRITSYLCFWAALPAIFAYPEGPPVEMDGVCRDMFPTGHNADAQPLNTAPFEFIIDVNCYNENTTVPVSIKTKASSSAEIEGIFVQARKAGSTEALGEFSVTDPVLSTLKCGTERSAVGHNEEKEAHERKMTWKATGNLQDDITFRATVVETETIFWVGITSDTIGRCGGSGNRLHTPSYILALALFAFVVKRLA